MTDIYLDLRKTTLYVRDNSESIVSHGFIVTFPGDKDKKTSRPFLVISSKVEIKDGSYVELPIIDNLGKKAIYREPIAKNMFASLNQHGLDVLVLPIAHVYNNLMSRGFAIDFKTIPEDLILNDAFNEKLSTFENVCTFSHNNDFEEIAFYRKDSLSEIKNADTFYVDNQGIDYVGSPVFIFNQSTYVENNSINIGSRLFLVGISVKRIGSVAKIQSMKKVVEIIKILFNFDTDFDKTNQSNQ